ncbi:uncharacterized protein cmpy [Drosophila pseudoobscura]|uniref:Uncharacterized protein cmpy n=1 Tax=Drosophila pseudoobscura pseudoobscura TaxID=46245 RepID=A0A6I8WA91_DROPS|nr:uncharacterized protein LOC6900290 [Drosophila pseudoobscura]
MGGRAKGSGKGRQDGRSLDVGAMDIRTRTTVGGEEPAVAEPHRMGGAGQGGVKQYNKANKLPHRMRRNGSYFGRLNVSVFLIYLWCYLLLIMAASGGSNNVVNGLKCYCNPKECDVIRSLDCPGKGLMLWDPCKCCRICAKTLGESCGGPGGFSGQCEPPLQCVTKLPISSGLGVCMDLQHLTALTSSHDNCTEAESIVLQPGCEITNKRCQCWPIMRTCLSELSSDGASPNDSRWHFKNLEDCQLNLQNLIKLELEFDGDYKISPSKFTYKKLRRKRKSLRKRIIILDD